MTPNYPPLAVWLISLRWRVAAAWNRVVRIEHGPYGNIIVRAGSVRAQRSGHGIWADITIHRATWWRNAKTGKHISLHWNATP